MEKKQRTASLLNYFSKTATSDSDGVPLSKQQMFEVRTSVAAVAASKHAAAQLDIKLTAAMKRAEDA